MLRALPNVTQFRVDLYGSLAMTGVGHGTPNAILMGLEGETPEGVNPKTILSRVDEMYKMKKLKLNGTHEISFIPEKHLLFHFNQFLPQHPNGMRFSAYDKEGELIATNEFFSIGGGFVVNDKTQLEANAYYLDQRIDHVENVEPTPSSHTEAELMMSKALEKNSAASPPAQTRLESKLVTAALPFHNAQSLIQICETQNISIAQVVFQNELQWRSADEITARTLHIWDVMNQSIQNGISASEEYLPGGLRVKRRAPGLHAKLMRGLAEYALGAGANRVSKTAVTLGPEKLKEAPIRPQRSLPALDWISLYALAVNEENASGGRVVTSPTNGAAGIIPAVLKVRIRAI
ncbi:hypothetical protein HDV03_004067 [Kappamyces sp. JEL0829]|nr:hypothetical protein HDV03_004067 [Kappamyces sp. JEL0829]